MTRVLVFSLLGFLSLIVLGPVQELLALDHVVVDVPLIIVIYLAMSERGLHYGRFNTGSIDWSGGVTAFILGYISDVMGSGTKGLHCLGLAVVFLFCRRAARQVYLAGSLSAFLVALVSSLGTSLLTLGIRWLLGVPPTLGSLTIVLVQALVCAAIAPLLIRGLRFVDQRVVRDSTERGTILP